ncbi:hypothetical protein [Prevotella intermedia]|uniref:hypothetical protein n=1 Tax=Prevotella intermedia TaxID=28131 RepID=UPI001E5C9F84|nr:hypothetical protein [Prevotella intermedia]
MRRSESGKGCKEDLLQCKERLPESREGLQECYNNAKVKCEAKETAKKAQKKR